MSNKKEKEDISKKFDDIAEQLKTSRVASDTLLKTLDGAIGAFNQKIDDLSKRVRKIENIQKLSKPVSYLDYKVYVSDSPHGIYHGIRLVKNGETENTFYVPDEIESRKEKPYGVEIRTNYGIYLLTGGPTSATMRCYWITSASIPTVIE